MTAKTVGMESKIIADNYRASQSVAAAQYAMDYGVNYFDNGGFDQNHDDAVDVITPPDLVSADGLQITHSEVKFKKDQCGAPGAPSTWKSGRIEATGYSDDRVATRTITLCVGSISFSPKKSLAQQKDVEFTGIVRFEDNYDADTIIFGSEGEEPEAEDFAPSNFATPFDFFKDMFDVNTRGQFKYLAEDRGQVYTDIADADSKSGPIWIEGDTQLSGVTIGSSSAPAIVVVNGDLSSSTGNSAIYGILYIIGTYDASGGSTTVVGATAIEGTEAPVEMDPENHEREVAASSPIARGSATLKFISWKNFFDNNNDDDGHPLPGLTAVISGSIRDW